MIDSIEFINNGAILRLSGEVTSAEIYEVNTKIFQHHGFESLRYQLWIFSSITDFIMSAEELRKTAKRDREMSEKNPAHKVAVVCASPLVFGMARMYEAFYGDGPWEIMIFYDQAKADEWLNS